MAWVLEKGSPADDSGRLEKERRCYRLLDGLGLEYWRCDHPDANADTMEDCLVIDAVLEAAVCKNLFLCNRQHTAFYLLMMPGDKPFKTKELSGQLGCARLSFAGPEEMERYLDITPGSVSILGLMNDTGHAVQLLVDEDVASLAVCLARFMDRRDVLRKLGENACSELYISWESAVKKACERYGTVIENHRSGKYQKHHDLTDNVFMLQASTLDTAQKIHDHIKSLRRR